MAGSALGVTKRLESVLASITKVFVKQYAYMQNPKRLSYPQILIYDGGPAAAPQEL